MGIAFRMSLITFVILALLNWYYYFGIVHCSSFKRLREIDLYKYNKFIQPSLNFLRVVVDVLSGSLYVS